jgi:hypothetical protein
MERLEEEEAAAQARQRRGQEAGDKADEAAQRLEQAARQLEQAQEEMAQEKAQAAMEALQQAADDALALARRQGALGAMGGLGGLFELGLGQYTGGFAPLNNLAAIIGDPTVLDKSRQSTKGVGFKIGGW